MEDLITVARFREPWEAHMLRGRLAAEGIPATVAHEFHVGNNWLYSDALGGAKVQVPDAMGETARRIASDCRRGVFHEMLRETLGDLDDPKCPVCGREDIRRGSSPLPMLIVFFALLPLMLVPAWDWIWHCRRCGAGFERS